MLYNRLVFAGRLFYTSAPGHEPQEEFSIMRRPTFHTPSARPRSRRVTLGAAASALGTIAALVACAVDDRDLAPTQAVEAQQPAGAGGGANVPAPAAPIDTAPIDTAPIDTDGEQTNTDATLTPSSGGTGSAAMPTQPAAEEPVAMAPELGAPLTVSGRVVDFFRRPLPNIPVTIAGTTVATDAQGQFSFTEVTAPYTASLTLSYERNNSPAHYGYVFDGLTRVDPTLQVYGGTPERGTTLTVAIQNADFAEPTREALFAFTSPDGSITASLGNAETTLVSPSWSGPATITGAAHALLVRRAGTLSSDPPVAYEAHQASTLAVSDAIPATTGFNLSPQAIPVANISGSASGGDASDRSNIVSLRFADGVVLPLIDESAPTEGFSYVVPVLPGASLSVAAANGFTAPFSVAHRENVAPGQAGLALAVPSPVTLGSPTSGAVVSDATPFVWSAVAQTASTFVWHLEFVDTFQGMFIITNRTTVTLPEFADGLSVPPDTAVFWSVETHGDQPSVDAATGPTGFLDAFALRADFPRGPSSADGYFTESERREFTVEP